MSRLDRPVVGKMIISIRHGGQNNRHSSESNNNKQQNNHFTSSASASKNQEKILQQIRTSDSKQYRLKDIVHHSGPVTIYQADHIISNRKVILKVIELDRLDSLDSVIDEIKNINKLRHTNIVPMLASFVHENCLWNVISKADYYSADLWSKPNGLPEIAIALIIKDVLKALSYLHNLGIIHRAVCGSHILIDSNGCCKLTGLKYSISVLQNGRWQKSIHQYPQNAVHLLNHMAPEILEQNLMGYNSKSDIYSVGIVCCELANGCIPFEEISHTEMLLDKLTGNFPRPLDSTCDEIRNFPTNNEDLPPKILEKYNLYRNRTFSSSFHTFTINRCLHFDTSSRPTADELLKHNFMKQTKKADSKLIDLLQNMRCKPSTSQTCNNCLINVKNQSDSDDKNQMIIDKLQDLNLKDEREDLEWNF